MTNPKPRHGSLQFYPRSRSTRMLPRVSWNAIAKKDGILGFIGYKVGMKSAYVKDNTPHSLTKGKRITMPVTIIECPTMKILSVRFYKDCLLYTSDAADDMQCVDLGGRRIIKKKKKKKERQRTTVREHSKTDDQKATTAG
eukprot:TRINITY_DN3560_c0_g1_i8.p1 TRINITY_DN3560_c0_g1~~TRINITY_DN3560_c0_g1_i8.p1  ORF type:complete len:141 (-),score=28.43 TRINITY_DN3560_c0_g1_i8:24-446(-)